MAHQSLAAQLAEHSITRKYNAVVYNGFTEDEGTVDEPIGRNPQDRKKMAVTQKHSRHAVTHYRVIERMEKFTLIEAQLETCLLYTSILQRGRSTGREEGAAT